MCERGVIGRLKIELVGMQDAYYSQKSIIKYHKMIVV